MIPKLVLLTQPQIDLRPFVEIFGMEKVNKVDAQFKNQPTAKFAALAEELLPDNPMRHLHCGFYFELAYPSYVELTSHEGITFGAEVNGMMVSGVMTASLTCWYDFLIWGTAKERTPYLRAFVNLVYDALKGIAYFKTLNVVTNQDRTFALVRT